MNKDKTAIGYVGVGSSAVTVAIATILATFASSFGATAASTIGFTEPNAAISIRPDYGITDVTAQMGTNAYLPCKVSIANISDNHYTYIINISLSLSSQPLCKASLGDCNQRATSRAHTSWLEVVRVHSVAGEKFQFVCVWHEEAAVLIQNHIPSAQLIEILGQSSHITTQRSRADS